MTGNSLLFFSVFYGDDARPLQFFLVYSRKHKLIGVKKGSSYCWNIIFSPSELHKNKLNAWISRSVVARRDDEKLQPAFWRETTTVNNTRRVGAFLSKHFSLQNGQISIHDGVARGIYIILCVRWNKVVHKSSFFSARGSRERGKKGRRDAVKVWSNIVVADSYTLQAC